MGSGALRSSSGDGAFLHDVSVCAREAIGLVARRRQDCFVREGVDVVALDDPKVFAFGPPEVTLLREQKRHLRRRRRDRPAVLERLLVPRPPEYLEDVHAAIYAARTGAPPRASRTQR